MSRILDAEPDRRDRFTVSEFSSIMNRWGGTDVDINNEGDYGQVAIFDRFQNSYMAKRAKKLDEKDIFREARSDYEVGILGLLAKHAAIDPPPVSITTVRDRNYPGLFVADYMPGFTIKDEDMSEMLRDQEQDSLGKKLAQFMVWFSDAISIHSPEFRMLYHPSVRPYDRRKAFMTQAPYLKEELRYKGQTQLLTVASDLLNENTTFRQQGLIKERNIIGQNGLKGSNLIFDYDGDNLGLKRVIDCGGAIETTAEQELRRVPLMGDRVLQSAIEEYRRLTGITLDEEVIRFWDKVHFVDFADNIVRGASGLRHLPFVVPQIKRLYPYVDIDKLTREMTKGNARGVKNQNLRL